MRASHLGALLGPKSPVPATPHLPQTLRLRTRLSRYPLSRKLPLWVAVVGWFRPDAAPPPAEGGVAASPLTAEGYKAVLY